MGHLLHNCRHRNQHADLHRHSRAGLWREHDVPAAGHRLHHRPRPRQHPVHPGLLSRRAVHVVRAAAAALRHQGQDARRRDFSHYAIAGGRHSPVHDGPRHLDRHAGAGDRRGPGSRRRHDRLHHARRRVGGDLDRRRADVCLHCRCRSRGLVAAGPHSRWLARSRPRRAGDRTVRRVRPGLRPVPGVHDLGRPVRRRRADTVNARHRSVPGAAPALGPQRQRGLARPGPQRLHRVRTVRPVPADRRDAVRVLPARPGAADAVARRPNPADLRRQ